MIKIITNRPSESAARLRRGLGDLARRNLAGVWPPNVIGSDLLTINWGVGVDFRVNNHMLNPPQGVRISSNKIQAFKAMKMCEVPCVPFRIRGEDEIQEVNGNGFLMGRRIVSGSCGAGIEIIGPGMPVPEDITLFTKYVKPLAEYRVHVMNGRLLQVSQKRLRNGQGEIGQEQSMIRNHDNQWIFAVNNVAPYPAIMIDTAVRAVAACGLDFGAVDILVPEADNSTALVLEINSKPGIEGTTLEKYIEAFKDQHRRVGG